MPDLHRVHYDPDTGKVLGLYDPKWDGEVPEPFKEIPDELVENICGESVHNHFDPISMTTSRKDLEERDAEWEAWRRSWRNKRLNSTDKYLTVPDFPITEEQRQELIEYRQALRDYPLTWEKPKVPSFLPFNS